MEKAIRIKGDNLKLRYSLFTIISSRNVFGTELFSDVKKIEVKKRHIRFIASH